MHAQISLFPSFCRVLINAELSEVLWNMMFHLGLHVAGGAGIIMVFAVFAVWAGKTGFHHFLET